VKVRAAQATTIVLFALVMGVFWGTWFSLSRTMDQLSGETFVAVGHQMIRNLGMPMAILLPLALLSALVTLALLWPGGRRAAFWWLAAGFLLMVAALVITLAVEVPIDNQIQDWTAATLPADWRSIQARWELWHTIRTFASIAAVVATTISAAVTTRPDRRPGNQVGRQAERSPGTGRRDHTCASTSAASASDSTAGPLGVDVVAVEGDGVVWLDPPCLEARVAHQRLGQVG
jgi:uncharacterized membrane protein